MASIGSLVVEMSANVASLQADLAKGRRAFQTFSRDVTSGFGRVEASLRGVRNLIGAFGVGLGLRELVAFGKQVIDNAGGLADLATQLGISTKALQDYRYAATQSGLKTETLEAAFQKLRLSTGQAMEGSKEVITALDRMGVKILDVNGNLRSSEAIFGDIADAYVNAKDKAGFIAAAQVVMGRNFQDLIPLISDGKKGLDDFAKAAREAGAEISDESIATLNKFGDEMAALGIRIEATAATILAKLIPAVRQLGPELEEFYRNLRKATPESFFTPAPGTAGPLAKIAPSAVATGGGVVKFLHGGMLTGTAFTGEAGGAGGLLALPPNLGVRPEGIGGGAANPPITGGGGKTPADVLKDLRFQIEQLNRTPVEQDVFKALDAAGLTDASSAMGQAIAGAARELDRLKLAQDAANESFQRGAELAEREEEERRKASERAKELIASRDELVAGYGRELEQGRALNAALQEGQQAYEVEAKYQEIANRFRQAGLPLYGAEIDKAKALAGQLVDLDRIREVTDAMREFGNTIQDDVIGGITGLVSGTEELNDVLKQLLQDVAKGLLDILNKSSATGSIGESLFQSIIGEIPSMWAGTGSGTSAAMGVDLAGFAEGGRPPVGQASIVGEQGPELFVPDVGGTVLPNAVLRQLGRAGMQVNIDARGATRDAVPAMMQQLEALQAEQVRLRRDVAPLAIAAVGNERRRSTGYAKTFRGKGGGV